MDFLEKKIAEEFQKDKWKVKTLGEIINSKIFDGIKKITHRYKGEGNCPIISCEHLFNSEIFVKNFKNFGNESLAKEKFFVEKGDLLMVFSGFSSKKLGKVCAYLCNEKGIAGNNIAVIKHSQNPKYLAYMMSSQYVKKQIKNLYKGGNRAEISKKELKKIRILLPDLETQNKIVEFLDKFINLKHEMEAEMEAEMEKRSKQYEYYKELIFS